MQPLCSVRRSYLSRRQRCRVGFAQDGVYNPVGHDHNQPTNYTYVSDGVSAGGHKVAEIV